MGAMGAATTSRTFWWDRSAAVDTDVQPLRAVVFDADTVLGEVDGDGDLVAKAGLIDLVMSLFVEGIWVAVVSRRDRESAQQLVRQLIGDGLVETIVSADDLDGPASDRELYRLALWELGVCARLRTGRHRIDERPAGGARRRTAYRAGHQRLHRRPRVRRRRRLPNAAPAVGKSAQAVAGGLVFQVRPQLFDHRAEIQVAVGSRRENSA